MTLCVTESQPNEQHKYSSNQRLEDLYKDQSGDGLKRAKHNELIIGLDDDDDDLYMFSCPLKGLRRFRWLIFNLIFTL